jgi:hypothetical protein
MEAQMEDGVYVAMSYDVHVIFGDFVLVGVDDVCVYAAYSGRSLEYGV